MDNFVIVKFLNVEFLTGRMLEGGVVQAPDLNIVTSSQLDKSFIITRVRYFILFFFAQNIEYFF